MPNWIQVNNKTSTPVNLCGFATKCVASFWVVDLQGTRRFSSIEHHMQSRESLAVAGGWKQTRKRKRMGRNVS